MTPAEEIKERYELLVSLKHKVIQYHSTIDDCIDYMERETDTLLARLEELQNAST
jgi:hypothetical protein